MQSAIHSNVSGRFVFLRAAVALASVLTLFGCSGAIDPAVVRVDRIPVVSGRPPLSQFHVLARPEAEFPTGVRGDTSRVSAELGRRALDHVVTEFARLLERVSREGREW